MDLFTTQRLYDRMHLGSNPPPQKKKKKKCIWDKLVDPTIHLIDLGLKTPFNFLTYYSGKIFHKNGDL